MTACGPAAGGFSTRRLCAKAALWEVEHDIRIRQSMTPGGRDTTSRSPAGGGGGAALARLCGSQLLSRDGLDRRSGAATDGSRRKRRWPHLTPQLTLAHHAVSTMRRCLAAACSEAAES